jgi:hypothetical protein
MQTVVDAVKGRGGGGGGGEGRGGEGGAHVESPF